MSENKQLDEILHQIPAGLKRAAEVSVAAVKQALPLAGREGHMQALKARKKISDDFYLHYNRKRWTRKNFNMATVLFVWTRLYPWYPSETTMEEIIEFSKSQFGSLNEQFEGAARKLLEQSFISNAKMLLAENADQENMLQKLKDLAAQKNLEYVSKSGSAQRVIYVNERLTDHYFYQTIEDETWITIQPSSIKKDRQGSYVVRKNRSATVPNTKTYIHPKPMEVNGKPVLAVYAFVSGGGEGFIPLTQLRKVDDGIASPPLGFADSEEGDQAKTTPGQKAGETKTDDVKVKPAASPKSGGEKADDSEYAVNLQSAWEKMLQAMPRAPMRRSQFDELAMIVSQDMIERGMITFDDGSRSLNAPASSLSPTISDGFNASEAFSPAGSYVDAHILVRWFKRIENAMGIEPNTLMGTLHGVAKPHHAYIQAAKAIQDDDDLKRFWLDILAAYAKSFEHIDEDRPAQDKPKRREDSTPRKGNAKGPNDEWVNCKQLTRTFVVAQITAEDLLEFAKIGETHDDLSGVKQGLLKSSLGEKKLKILLGCFAMHSHGMKDQQPKTVQEPA